MSFPATGALLAPLSAEVSAVEAQELKGDVDLWPRLTPAVEEVYADRVQEAPAPFGPLQHLVRPTQANEPIHVPVLASVPAPFPVSGPQTAFDFRIIGQAAASYIVLEDETGLRVIDQHALHERILFERLLASALKHARADAQGLLVPEPVELSAAQAALVGADSSALELLSDMGFECEPFGPRSLLIRAMPAIIKHASPAKLVSDYLDALAGSSDDSPANATSSRSLRRFSLREKSAYIISCKAALKAGERLTHAQMEAMILEFRAVAGPLAERGNLTCPHGRKLSLDVSWHDLERAVGRA